MNVRVIGVYCAVAMAMLGLVYRLFYIDASDYIAMAAADQGGYSLKVATTRGMIYDRELRGLVNNGHRYVASVLPSPQAAAAVLPHAAEGERPAVVQRLSGGLPFAMRVPSNEIYARGVDVFRIPDRYAGYNYAPHVIGYLDGDNLSGVAGIELAYDDLLRSGGGEISCSYSVDAAGHVMSGAAMDIARENEEPLAGVCLTIDRELQRLVQDTLKAHCEMGAAVVLDVRTGEILAIASLPEFEPGNIAASLNSPDAPFISRAVSGYNIGSVFKVLVSSAAVEKGISPARENYCSGTVDIGGVKFRCNNDAVHGMCDMQRALNVSCNAYFITLAQEIGADYLPEFVRGMGLGSAVSLAPGMTTQAGNLPTAQELMNPAELANFGFGQGVALASPLQIAAAVAEIANGGTEVTPGLVLGVTQDGEGVSDIREPYAPNRVMSGRTAETVRRLMVNAVAEGSGRTAAPKQGGAGGKTSSAQTGKFKGGEEIVHAWFAGFYPAEGPRYSIAVFVEGGGSGEQEAAPIFKEIADGIAGLTN
jgi:penicillin-binding protein 2